MGIPIGCCDASVAEHLLDNPQIGPIFEPIVGRILAENPQSIADYKQGRTKALAFLVGQVMKETKASPDVVNELILKKI